MITLKRFRMLEKHVREAGYGAIIDWTEAVDAPVNADAFAEQVIYVICNSGMNNRVAQIIHDRCIGALKESSSATTVFGHPGKAPAIDQIWERREGLFAEFTAAPDKLAFCASLPWIGPVTKHHLSKNFGIDTAKPDVHMERLAKRDKCNTQTLCRRLARKTGYRVATIDTILWRACADGFLDSRSYEHEGWRAAYKGGF
jgi:hypothetical protein